jgi:hypothetical protein
MARSKSSPETGLQKRGAGALPSSTRADFGETAGNKKSNKASRKNVDAKQWWHAG